MKQSGGYSLVELLVVVAVFSVLAIVGTQTMQLALRSSTKSESTISVRENLSYTFAVIERNLYNAEKVNCTLTDTTHLYYTDEYGNNVSFSCENGANGYIASNSSRLTNQDVTVRCDYGVFTCTTSLNNPTIVQVRVTASQNSSQGALGSEVTLSTNIVLRGYKKQ